MTLLPGSHRLPHSLHLNGHLLGEVVHREVVTADKSDKRGSLRPIMKRVVWVARPSGIPAAEQERSLSSYVAKVIVEALARRQNGPLGAQESALVVRWAATDMRTTRERRRTPRKKSNLAVRCESQVEHGVARMVNVSLSGALLEHASIRPERDAVVRVLFSTPRARRSTQLSGTVARHTETGFAIQFLTRDGVVRQLVAEAA